MQSYSGTQVLQYLEKQKLIKFLNGVYYFTDKFLAIADDINSPKQALRDFCEKIGIPFQVPSPQGGKYTIKYVTDRIGKMYLNVLKKVDEDELVEVTKKYYKETQYPVTIKTYFEDGVWEIALEAKDQTTSSSFSSFED